MPFEEALINLLLGSAAVAALVGDRVFPVSRPQGSSLPAITVRRSGGGIQYDDDGESGLENPQMQITSWGLTYAQAKGTARAVVKTLSAFDGLAGGVDFQYVMLDAERDIREAGADSSEYLFGAEQDWNIWLRG